MDGTETQMTRYVVGFAFSPDYSWVLLLREAKPPWQAGRLNGVGGKIEAGETAQQAMAREFAEEVGIVTSENQWRVVAAISDNVAYELDN